MAKTTNIGLQKFEGSDYVSREAINANYDKIDEALGIDYICERGRSGDWEWVKYASGHMEQWITRKAFPTQTLKPWNDDHLFKRTDSMDFGNFPIAFVEPPLCNINFVDNEDKVVFASFIVQWESSSTTAPPQFYIVDPTDTLTSINTPYCGIHARGYWK